MSLLLLLRSGSTLRTRVLPNMGCEYDRNHTVSWHIASYQLSTL